MRRAALVLTLALVFTIPYIGNTYTASAAPSSWSNRLANVHACPSPWWHHHSPTVVRNLVACEARLFGVSVSTALYVANRESRFYYRAYNHSGCGGSGCGGIFQHHMGYWYGRVRTYAPNFRSWWWNPRTQAVVTMKMVRAGGWGPWSTA